MTTALWIAIVVLISIIAMLLIDIINLHQTMRLHDEALDFNLRLMGFDGLHDVEQ